jgi:serine/threonine protein kinase
MVFPYMDHDLAGLLENDRVKLQPSQIKLYMKQLLEGTEYMHRVRLFFRGLSYHLTYPHPESYFTSRYEGSKPSDLK